ncbi:MAG: TerB family tellurite resistance protein [Polyangiales bacterium]
MTWNSDQLAHIADILMAAAHSDGSVENVEDRVVREIIAGLAGGKSPALDARIKSFKASAFDLDKAAAALKLTTSAQRKELLQLVAKVTESDDVHDLDESDFIVGVAKAIGASKDEYAGMTISLEESGKPPPLPSN